MLMLHLRLLPSSAVGDGGYIGGETQGILLTIVCGGYNTELCGVADKLNPLCSSMIEGVLAPEANSSSFGEERPRRWR
jgi:LytS/YehU family sensor histidine kinase